MLKIFGSECSNPEEMGDLAKESNSSGGSTANDAVVFLDWKDTIKSSEEIVERENRIGSKLQI